jgi:hypothetical protein
LENKLPNGRFEFLSDLFHFHFVAVNKGKFHPVYGTVSFLELEETKTLVNGFPKKEQYVCTEQLCQCHLFLNFTDFFRSKMIFNFQFKYKLTMNEILEAYLLYPSSGTDLYVL